MDWGVARLRLVWLGLLCLLGACGDDAEAHRDAAPAGDGGVEDGGRPKPRSFELSDGIKAPFGPDGQRLSPEHIEDAWVSYGNGPSNWFANLAESELDADNASGLRLLWKIDSEVTSPPVIYGGRVFVSTAHDGLYAFKLEDGEVIWHEEEVSSFSAPAYDPATDMLYVNRWEGGVLHAFDAASGKLRWSMPIDDQEAVRGWSSPVVSDGQLLVGIASSDRGTTFKGGLAAFDLAMEDRAWSYIHAEEQAAGVAVWAGPSIDPQRGLVFAASGNNYTLAGGHSDSLFGVDLGKGELMWNQQTAENDRWAYDCITCGPDHDFGTNPILIDFEDRELLAAGQKSGSFWLLDRATGEVLWEHKVSSTSHPLYGGVLNNGAFDGTRILVAANEGAQPGTLFALDPDPDADERVLWERPLDALVIAPITVAAGLAFVPVGTTMEVVECESGKTLAVLEADAPVTGAAAVAQGHVFFGSGLSYFDNGAQPGAFYAYGLPDGGAPSGPSDVTDAGKDDKPREDAGNGGPADDRPTFTRVFEEIIVGTGCNGGPLCHGGSVGGLPMVERDATYEALVGVKAMGTNLADTDNANCVDTGKVRVVPGEPDESLLVQKVDPEDGQPPCGALMPPTGLLQPDEIALIRAWIEAGARDD